MSVPRRRGRWRRWRVAGLVVWVEGEGGVVGEFEVVAAGVAADDPALLQGDDGLWVEVPVALGEGAWGAGDDVEDSGGPGAQGRPEARSRCSAARWSLVR